MAKRSDYYHIRDFTPKDTLQVAEIADRELGKGYFNIHQPHSVSIFKVAVTLQGEVIGFCYSFISTSDELPLKDQWPFSPNLSAKTGILKTIAIKSGHKRKGVGKELINGFLKILTELQVKQAVTLGWKSRKGSNIHQLMLRSGFQLHREIPHFWKEDSIQKG